MLYFNQWKKSQGFSLLLVPLIEITHWIKVMCQFYLSTELAKKKKKTLKLLESFELCVLDLNGKFPVK